MKAFGIYILTIFFYNSAVAQVDLGTITAFIDQPQKKIENYLHKKGFTKESFLTAQELIYSHKVLEDSLPINRSFQFALKKDGVQLLYKTTSAKEFTEWKKSLHIMATPFASNEKSDLYFDLRHNIIIHFQEEKLDTNSSYTLSASRKSLPKIKDLVFAEDLLEIDAHVYLESIFGKQNVKEDYFFFSESLKKKCSIIFPNTNRQAIFLWNDELNMKDLSFIIIGEYESRSAQNMQSPLTLAQWRSKQGVTCGMNLKELEMLNQKEINFHRWRSPMSGTLSKNNGTIDFSQIEIVLDCMNCSFVSSRSDAMVISSLEAADQNQKWYVRSFAVIRSKVPAE
jgi:hypothetical protein